MDDVRKVAAFLRARLTEGSTWAGIAAGCATGAAKYSHFAQLFGAAGFLAAGVAFLLKDRAR